ncbi:hypothetical protein PRK78_003373 [Emydomyces testavorans]|uniref:Uncharacterized protein n=1 Tax=Emydomyces testavorans TaxID=2070801 RepID=A0AAF0DI29_9EURO|nr:hypothetical protein PRK78_003373 [Emydomyces testavorans]
MAAMAKSALARDINNLVALASTTNVDTMAPLHRMFANWPSHVISQRYTPQDAVATILLDGRSRESYAVGINIVQDLDKGSSTVALYISTNQGASDLKTLYLKDVWQVLQKRAKRYEAFYREKEEFVRERARNPPAAGAQHVREPTMPPALYHDLMRMVYRHCFKRWLKWIHSSYGDMSRFKNILMAAVGNVLDSRNPNWHTWLEPLTYLIEQFDWVCNYAESLKRQGRDPMQLVSHGDFPAKMERLEEAYSYFEKDKAALQKIEEWNAMGEDQEEAIITHLRKFAELQIAIVELDYLCRYPRGFNLFQNRSLEVTYIDESIAPAILTPMPIDADAWKAVLTQALQYRGFSVKPEHESEVSAHMVGMSSVCAATDDPTKPTMHPLVQVLQFFLTTRIHPPPLRHIGVSHSTCAACAAVFTAYNQLHASPSYRCRASDGHWPTPWNVPTEWAGLRVASDTPMLDAVYKKVAERLGSALYETKVVNWGDGRDSSSATDESGSVSNYEESSNEESANEDEGNEDHEAQPEGPGEQGDQDEQERQVDKGDQGQAEAEYQSSSGGEGGESG